MNTLKLIGTREIKTTENFDANKDYGILLVASRVSKEIPDSFEEDDGNEIIYKLKVSEIQSVMELRESKPIEFEHGKTPSQKLRYVIECELGKEEYEDFMGYLMGRIGELTEDYRERK